MTEWQHNWASAKQIPLALAEMAPVVAMTSGVVTTGARLTTAEMAMVSVMVGVVVMVMVGLWW